MQVDMLRQVLPSRMQQRHYPQLSSHVLGPKLLQRLPRRLEQQIVNHSLIPAHQWIDRMVNGKDKVIILYRFVQL